MQELGVDMQVHSITTHNSNKWVVLNQDLDRPLNAADTNQLLLNSEDKVTLIDPGGIEIFPTLLATLNKISPISKIENIIFTSADPQSVSSLPLWRQVCAKELNIWAPSLWGDLIGHIDSGFEICPIPEDGIELLLSANCRITLIPSHFLHSPASYSVYDPKVGLLYSGSVGSSITPARGSEEIFVSDFQRHEDFLLSYHTRWFISSRARDQWLGEVEKLDIRLLVPQRGPIMTGKNIQSFFKWFKSLRLGAAVFDPFQSATEAEVIISEFSEVQSTRGFLEKAPNEGFRLVTRSDFDGIACAVILEELGKINDILFADPHDMQEGRVDITERDIIANLPYVKGCYLAFDHHMSEVTRVTQDFENHINQPEAPSTARIIYTYFGGEEKLPRVSKDMMLAVDQNDSARYDIQDVLNSESWALLSFIMDPRSGLGRFHGFRVPHFEMMMSLVEYCRVYRVKEILDLPDIKERADFLKDQREVFQEQLRRCAKIYENLIVLDLLEEPTIYAGNRFMIYALFPECNISMTLTWGRGRQKIICSVGKSIFDRSSKTNVGYLMLNYGGGGHEAAGTCHINPAILGTVKEALVRRICEDG